MDLNTLTIRSAHQGLKNKKFSSVELTEACLKRIDEVDEKIKAFVTVCRDGARSQAKKTDEKIAKGEEISVLEGIPMSAKDMYCTKNVQTTAGSRVLEGFKPPYDATVFRKLKEKGAVLVGKNTQDEFGHGVSSENTGFDIPHNPWNLKKVAGGSSGGSAAAVSASEVFYSLGTDTGGSIRQPSALCSVVGLKPTYGRSSRYGVVAMASSLDTMSCMGRTVSDVAEVFKFMAGKDELDSTTVDIAVPDYPNLLEGDIKGLKIGMPKEYFGEGVSDDVKNIVQKAVEELENLGAQIIDISLPHTKYGIAAYYIICPSEVSANLARYDGVRYGPANKDAKDLFDFYTKNRSKFHPEVKRRIMIGTYSLSSGYYDAYYLKAQKIRTLVKKDFDEAFEKVDAIVTPTSPTVAFGIGEKVSDPLSLYMCDVLTIPASLAGICGLSVPCGFSSGLPVGLQILGPQFKEEVILKIGQVYEKATEWGREKPKLANSKS